MPGITTKKKIILSIIAVAGAAAIFAALYYMGVFLPSYTVWHNMTLEDEDNDLIIELKNRKVSVKREGKVIFTSPGISRVSDMIYSDIDRDGEKELVLLNYNIGRFGNHRPFWVKFDPPVWHQHIYIYDYDKERDIMRPVWMASDIGLEASGFEIDDKEVILIMDRYGKESRWMWISFGLRCVD